MEEDLGVIVTRLRRRLSVESDDVKSPSTPLTPTKKRGGRLAAKPQLELINESETENVIRRPRRKSVSKDAVEPLDEKPVTPSRRSARIRSNTSIVSETTQSYSPRAKRAARRTSQVGSDNEPPVTPGRQTRRTRLDSTSSLEKKAGSVSGDKITAQVVEVIGEEPEGIVREVKNDDKSNNSSVIRKSPRLKEKDDKNNISKPDNEKNDNKIQDNRILDTFKSDNESNDKQTQNDGILNVSTNNDESKMDKTIQDTESAALSPVKDKAPPKILSTSSNLLNKISTDSKVKKNILNKTDSAVEVMSSKRHRTHSGTTVSVAPTNNISFYSDNERSNKDIQKDKLSHVNNLGSGDGLLINTGKEDMKGVEQEKEEMFKQKNQKENSMTGDSKDSISKILPPNKSVDLNKSATKTYICTKNNEETILHAKSKNDTDSSEIAALFDKAPANAMQSLVFIEDSDSNTGNIEKPGMITRCDGEDQCVPVVDHPSQIIEEPSKGLETNVSYEPMDIDETIPENLTMTDCTEKNNSCNEDKGLHLKQNVPSFNSVKNKDTSETSKKSDRKSSISRSMNSPNLETSSNENKSTLILSQIRDVSSAEINSMSKSPKDIKKEELLSKFVNIQDGAKEKDDKQNLSVNYSTSTPLQQKSVRKLGMRINTSNIIPNVDCKTETNEITDMSKKETSNISKSADCKDSSEDEQSEEKSFKKKCDVIDDEAEEASDDYESGDSRDENERQYEEENEIIHKGETLDSEDDLSDDTDYEKDSFVVSSDEEDQDLLSGSGDDLSMSDNELTMSAKSKKKYNDSKCKEQKKASREMYKARHKLNDSDNSSELIISKPKKFKPQRLDSFLLDSEDEGNTKTKKTNYNRILDSSQGTSMDDSDDEYIGRKKKKSKRLSESLYNDNAVNEVNEKEITICNNSGLEKNDPLTTAIKLEPKTPQKELNISSTLFTNRDDVEEMDIDENVSIARTNETSDPLQATAQFDDSSTSSDQLEIVENYNSLLNNLNSETGIQIKSIDISLNLNTKPKEKKREPVIDQLNLTQTKKSKRVKKISIKKNTETHESQNSQETGKTSEIIINENEGSSDSIDMRLLFPEDSNDCESNGNKSKEENKDANSPVADFIPLKRTVAKTNIPENNSDISASKHESQLNVSKEKKINRKSSRCSLEKNVSFNDQQENNVNFFIDTTGSLFSLDTSVNTSLTGSSKKNKKKTNSVPHNKDLEVEAVPNDNECLREKKKKNKKRSSVSDNKDLEVEEVPPTIECDSEKKKKYKKNSTSDNLDLKADEVPAAIECHSEKKKKNKKNRISDNKDLEIERVPAEIECYNEKKKKSKKNSISDNQDSEIKKVPGEIECHSEKKKKNKKNSISDSKDSEIEKVPVEIECHSGKKKKNKKNSISDNKDSEIEMVPVEIECHSEKKNKNSISDNKDSNIEEAPIQGECYSENNKKKNKLTPDNNTKAQIEKIDDQQENDVNIFIDTTDAQNDLDSSVNKKKKKNKNNSFSNNKALDYEEVLVEIQYDNDKKKKINKQTLDCSQNNSVISGDKIEKSINTFLTAHSSEKKKKMLSQSLNIEKTDKRGNAEAVHNTSVDSAQVLASKYTLEVLVTDKSNIVPSNQEEGIRSKKRKRKSSADPPFGNIVEDVKITNTTNSNISLNDSRQKKKPKIAYNNEGAISGFVSNNIPDTENNDQTSIKKSKKNKKTKADNSQIIEEEIAKQNINKKRKERDDDYLTKKSKVFKENSFDKIHVPRLPAFILNQLDDKPKKESVEKKKSKAISTTQFFVEEALKKKNKPSNYLEESIYLNDSPVVKKQKSVIKKPKVLPFIPTASLSVNGYTSNFKINVLPPQETRFVAQSSHVNHFKNSYLQDKRIKKLGTLERYKKHRNVKISKF